MIHIYCDGSKKTFKPKYQRTTECFECGAVHKLKPPIVLNKPDFHKGPLEDHKCKACGKEGMDIDLLIASKIIEKRCVEVLIKEFEKTSKFFDYLEKK